MLRAILIYNPAAGSGRTASTLEDVRSILGKGGVEVQPVPTEAPGHATEIAGEAARAGSTDWVLVYGGDGTVREAAKGILGSEVALAPLSAGTTNVVTRSLGLPIDPRQAAAALLEATPIAGDVGMCSDEPFLMQATLGMDAAVMAEVSSRLKRFAGRAAVALSGLGTWWRYEYPQVTYDTDGEPGKATFVAACNIARYAGDFRIAPDATFSTRRLDLLTFTGSGRRATLRFLLQMALGRHLELSSVSLRPMKELVIEAPLHAPLQLDGDPMDLKPPLRLRLAEQRIRLLSAEVPTG